MCLFYSITRPGHTQRPNQCGDGVGALGLIAVGPLATLWAKATAQKTKQTCTVFVATMKFIVGATKIGLSLYPPILIFRPPFALSELFNFDAFYLRNLSG